MTLEQAINKASDVLAKSGYPAMFMALRQARKTGEGGWELEYEQIAMGRVVTVEIDVQGNAAGITTKTAP